MTSGTFVASMNREDSMQKAALRYVTLFSLLALMAAASVYGQRQNIVRIDVPFEFIVANTTLPAGQYTVSAIPNNSTSSNVLLIRSTDGRQHTLVSTGLIEGKDLGGNSKLIFHRYGDRYFLSQVWTGEGRNGRLVASSQLERELTKNATKTQKASINGQ